MTPFDFINSISQNKKDLIRSADDPVSAEKEYNAFLVNKGLSYFADTVFYANEMNRYSDLSNKMQYDYLINSIVSRKRFAKWIKSETDDNLELVMQYFGFNAEKAKAALSILSSSDIEMIKQKRKTGGV